MTARDWLERFEQEVGQVPTVGQLINFVKERLGEISEQAAEACLRLRNQKVTEGGSSMSHMKDNAHEVDMVTPMSIVIFGATGDLAKKKLYPAVYQLMFGCPGAPLVPQNANVVGYGRSPVALDDFLAKQCVNVKGGQKEKFLKQCSFFSGPYDSPDSYKGLHEHLLKLEGGGKANRLFFFSIPPQIFGDVVKCIHTSAKAPGGGWTRLILEKPFGRDSASFAELDACTSKLFTEDEIFRIDHYLGKEIVLNIQAMRFGNQIFESFWNKEQIRSVQIVFKEDLGTGGRGGYFDQSGIIRDIMQNHLLQVLIWLAMEPPAKYDRKSVAEQKVKVLKAIPPLKMKDTFLGQFGKNTWECSGGKVHQEPGYLDDETVPAGSRCPTYAGVVLEINNARWKGVPFLMRAGKGLDERMAEVRITFKPQSFNSIIPGDSNELVLRIQPDEAVYFKYLNKVPGWDPKRAAPVVMDMSYTKSFPDIYVADAYERMFLNTAKGDGSLFVGSGELTEAWRIFTPLLHEIDAKRPEPVIYPFGARAPAGMDEFAAKYGITMAKSWEEFLVFNKSKFGDLRKVFDALDANGDGSLSPDEVKALARHFFDGREPTDQQVSRIMQRMDKDGNGRLTFHELEQGVEAMSRYCLPGYNKDQDFMADHLALTESSPKISAPLKAPS